MKFEFISKKNILLYLSIGLISYFLTFVITTADSDLWARLAVGSIFFQTGSILKQDIFAYTPTKNLWVDHEWGAGTVFYAFVHYFGDFGIYILKFLLIFSIFLLLTKIIKLMSEKTVNIDLSMLILLAFSIFPSVISTVRSQLFTYAFFVLWVYILEKVRRGENKLIWVFPVTMLLWANLHGGFVTGLGLLVIYAIGEALNKKNYIKYLKILAITIPVTLINPYGFEYWRYIAEAVSMPRPHILEWQHFSLAGPIITLFSIPIHLFLGFEVFAVLTLMVAIKQLINRSKIDWVKILLLFITLYLGLKHQRHLILFILPAFCLLYSQILDIFESIGMLIKSKLGDKNYNYLLKAKNIPAIALIIVIFSTQKLFSTNIYANPSIYPVGAIEFIKQNDLSGNLFVPYRWGSYALWKLYPQCLVAVDGRYEEVYPGYIFDMAADFSGDIDNEWNLYKNTKKLNPDWQNFINKFQTDIIILPQIQINHQKIDKLKDWKVVYTDNLSYVLLPKNKTDKLYINPDYRNPIYWHENLAKKIDLH